MLVRELLDLLNKPENERLLDDELVFVEGHETSGINKVYHEEIYEYEGDEKPAKSLILSSEKMKALEGRLFIQELEELL